MRDSSMDDPKVELQDDDEFFVIPEDQLHLLPEEWQAQIREVAANGRAVLRSVDNELTQLSRLSVSLSTLATLNENSRLLTEYRFEPNIQNLLYLEILTTAFAVTYVRLHQGGAGSGFSRASLPQKLRASHDQILELRNKRFAHEKAHHTIENMMEVQLGNDGFSVHPKLSIGMYIGGANEWHEIVQHLNNCYYARIDGLLARLRETTGHDWKMAEGPEPQPDAPAG